MTYFLKLFPPFTDGKYQNIRCIEENREEIKVSSIVNKVLDESAIKLKFRPEDVSVVVNDNFVNGEYKIENGDMVKIMLLAMGG